MVTIKLNERSGHYDIDGVKYPRVSKILDTQHLPEICNWRAWKGQKEADQILREAQDWGHVIHKACEMIGKGEDVDWEEDVEMAVLPYREFIHGKSIEAVEETVWCDWAGLKYAGTFDLLTRENDGLHLWDIKTGNNTSPLFLPQTMAYVMAYEQLYEEDIKRVSIINLPSRAIGSISFPLHYEVEEWCYDAWKDILRAYYTRKRIAKMIKGKYEN